MNDETGRSGSGAVPNGAALAAVMAAAIGSVAMGLLVILNEAGLFAAPSLYGPVGGLSGRSAFTVAAWLVAWAILHSRWRGQDVDPRRTLRWSLGLVVVSVILTFPPVWGLL